MENETELISLYQQRDTIIEDLRLIEVRESEIVLSTEIPRQLISDKQRLQSRLREIEQRIVNIADPRLRLKDFPPTTAPHKAEPYDAPTPNRIVWEKDGKEMVHVPAGKFLYGRRKKSLELPEFWIDKTPVTNAEYARFVAATGRKPPKHWKSKTPPNRIADHPVALVNWYDAVAYAEWAGKWLPIEEEWEKAARGTDGREYPWGDWEEGRCNTKEADLGRTTAVGQYSPAGDSPYGCVDMAGEIWEWTSIKAMDRRVTRGGSWKNDRNKARCAYRRTDYSMSSNADLGFRCVSPVF